MDEGHCCASMSIDPLMNDVVSRHRSRLQHDDNLSGRSAPITAPRLLLSGDTDINRQRHIALFHRCKSSGEVSAAKPASGTLFASGALLLLKHHLSM